MKKISVMVVVFFITGSFAYGATLGSEVRSPDQSQTGKVNYMFVQEAASGTLEPQADGSYRLELKGVVPFTIYFSDRPATIAGNVDMKDFIDKFDWGPDIPPNAAIVLYDANEAEDTLIAQLLSPAYDKETAVLSYTVKPLKNYTGDGLAYHFARQDASLPASFSKVSLYIDDCPDTHCPCMTYRGDSTLHEVGTIRMGRCFDFPHGCEVCHPGDCQNLCSEKYKDNMYTTEFGEACCRAVGDCLF
ncbi:MAG: hypothetical protein JXB42_12620 [Deltaproteobacteria bacterium]|nr:hypothetical protein [Deltaproteobacteria bacterium]